MQIQDSNRKGKRFVAIFKDGTKIHFGQSNAFTYIDGADKAKRLAYLKRHNTGREDWSNPRSAGALSRWILWGDFSNINGNIADFKRRFSL